jgi:hypothetical protein
MSDSDSDFITHELAEGDKLDHTTLHITLEVDNVESCGGVHLTDHRGEEWSFEREYVDSALEDGILEVRHE